MSRLKLWAGLLILFGAGVVTGMLGMSLYAETERPPRADHGPAARQERIMNRLNQELSLSPQQQRDIEAIVTRAHVAILELRFAHQAEVEQILAQGMGEIKIQLSPAQRQQLDTMYAELQQRWQASRDFLAAQKAGLAK
jgi:hypothetical protein